MTAMKLAVFVVALLASYPTARWLRERPGIRRQIWTLVGFLPFLDQPLIALYSFGTTPSDTNGFEVALIDWLALSLLLSAKPSDRRAPYRFTLSAYLLVVVASLTYARLPLLAAGYAWKLCRMVLLLLAIWRGGSEDRRVPAALLRGMLLGLLYEGGLAAWQHLVEGRPRAQGSFSGWNSLGIVANLVVMVPVARILAGPTSVTTKLAPLAALLAALFSVSRGALLFLGVGIALVWLGSALREFTPRKAWFGVLGLLLGAAITPVALFAIESRRTAERQESMETRERLDDAASMMLREHPAGVGASQFLPELLFGGYGRRAGLGWRTWVNIVHNVYWLTAAELGYAGLVALLVLFAAPLRTAFLCRARGPRGDVLLGLGVALVVFYAHSCFEWVWRLAEVSYLYFMTIAIVAVLARQDGPVFAAAMVRGARTAARRQSFAV